LQIPFPASAERIFNYSTMIGLNLWQKPQQIAVAAALHASQIMRAKLREPSYASQGILSGCSREHVVVKANFSTCLSAATVFYLFRTAHELVARPEALAMARLSLRADQRCPKGREKLRRRR